MMQRRSLVNAKHKAVLAVLKERQALVDSLARILGQLGLEPRRRPAKSLAEYIAENYGNGAHATRAPTGSASSGPDSQDVPATKVEG